MADYSDFSDVDGVKRVNNKYTDLTAQQYSGQARPGELVVDLNTYIVYVANANGILNPIEISGNLTYDNANVAAFLGAGVNANIIPSANVTYSLGNSTRQWKDLWVSNNTIYINSVPLSIGAGNVLTVNGDALLAANSTSSITTTGNITGNVLIINRVRSDDSSFVSVEDGLLVENDVGVAGNVTADYFLGNGSLLTGIAPSTGDFSFSGTTMSAEEMLIESTDADIVIRSDSDIFAEITNKTFVVQSDSGNWIFDGTTGNLSAPGNILITGNVTANSVSALVGNITNLDSLNFTVENISALVGNNGVNIGAGGFNNLVVLPTEVIVQNVPLNTAGNISANYFIGDGSQLTNISTAPGNLIENGDSNVRIDTPNGNVLVSANTSSWTFGHTGNLTIPGNIVTSLGAPTGNIVTNVRHWESAGANLYIWFDAASKPDVVAIGNYGNIVGWTVSVVDGNQALVTATNPAGYFSISTDQALTGSGNLTFTSPDYAPGVYNPAVIEVGGNSWIFANDGNLNLPSQGNIVGVTPNNAGRIQWIGNSSGDGFGYTTLGLIPDDTLTGNDQYLIIDPTAPGHIHIRAGGAQDNSNADLFLGGEYTHFKVTAGANNQARIMANSWPWTFGADGTFTLPANAELNGSQINSVANSSGDGAGYTTLQLVPDVTVGTGTDQYLIIDPTAPGHIHVRAGGTQDASSADLFLGGENSYFRVNAGANAEVQVTSNSNTWVFNVDGNLQVPGNINGDNSAPLRIDGASSGEGFISLPSASFGGEQVAIVNKFMFGNGIRLETNGGNLFFSDSADLSITGNIVGNTAGYTIGYRDLPQVTFTGDATLSATDAGKHYYSTLATANVLTIANNSSVSWAVGTAITVVNRGTGNITIAQAPDVNLYLAGNSTAGNRILTTYGMATLLNVAGNVWMINGTGVV